jgi:hypothetical protein
LAVGINSLGVELFFTRLLKSMGIQVTDNVAYYLKLREKHRMGRLQKIKTNDYKVKKNKRKYEALIEHTKIAKIERHKRHGTYRRGMNLDDPGVEELPTMANKKAKRVHCEYCGKSTHATRKSKKCTAKDATEKIYRKDGTLLTGPPAPITEDEDVVAAINADDCDAMDSTPWDADVALADDAIGITNPFSDADNDLDLDPEVFVVGGTI